MVGPQGTGVGRRSEGTPVPNYIDPRALTHDALVYQFMEKTNNKRKETGREKKGKEAPLGAEGWKDILQLLKEQGKKIEMLGQAIKAIQDGMRKCNPAPVKSSFGEVAEVIGTLLNTHKCLVESGMEIQKRMDSQPAVRKVLAPQRPRSASLGDTLKQPPRGEKGRPHLPLRTVPQRRGTAEHHPPPTQRPPRASSPRKKRTGNRRQIKQKRKGKG